MVSSPSPQGCCAGILMPDALSVALFAEDGAHELLIRPLLERVADEEGVRVRVSVRSATGGHGAVMVEARRFLRDIVRGRHRSSDLVVVGTDANCVGLRQRRREMDDMVADTGYDGVLVAAIPDPHVERWMLLDGKAFKGALGKGCPAPDKKCERDRYKQQLKACVRDAGRQPVIGGMECAAAIAASMDLSALERQDDSLAQFLSDYRRALASFSRR